MLHLNQIVTINVISEESQATENIGVDDIWTTSSEPEVRATAQ